MTELEPLLTTEEAADYFRVHPRTIIRWTRAGRLIAVQLPSGRPRYRRSDLEAMIGGDAA